MKKFPPGIKFCYPWRSYQAKVLNELEIHLQDDNLNIVAAPGSGKTILGLEVMLRIGKPTLILAPSIAIKNQWLERFKDHFLQSSDTPEWISENILDPKFITISTYQGLHAAFSHNNEPDSDPDEEIEIEREGKIKKTVAKSVLKKIKLSGVQTIIVDEAHHMRNAWWEGLEYLNSNLTGTHIISLTATPPYDVPAKEWNNYESLCGSIDALISVPELVAEKNLCPHQDYVYLSSLSRDEQIVVDTFRKHASDFIYRLQYDTSFIEYLLEHRYIVDSDTYIEEILWNVEYFSSILIFLKSAGHILDASLFEVVGVAKKSMPSFDISRAEILLENILYKDTCIVNEKNEYLSELKKGLKKIGAIERNIVSLHDNKKTKKLLKLSINKLDAIIEISKAEYKSLGSNLRMVVLTDYIRKEILPTSRGDSIVINKIGVVPIFEKLRQENSAGVKLGILCGSFVVIPKKAQESLYNEAKQMGIQSDDIRCKNMIHDLNYCSVNISGEGSRKIVQLITKLFHMGEIELLVGTKSLLGEGWDAPAINTLVLASSVGSFVLSNQMRGRSIRINKDTPNKVSNIWHIATIENKNNPGADFEILNRRFKAFVGVSFLEDTIENGFERMGIETQGLSSRNIKKINNRTLEASTHRIQLGKRWEEVLENGKIKEIVPQLSIDAGVLPRKMIVSNTIFSVLLGGIPFLLYKFLDYFIFSASESYGALFLAGISFLFFSPGLSRAGYLFLKNGTVSGEIQQIGKTVLESLYESSHIVKGETKIIIRAHKVLGQVNCHLEGATVYEKSIFFDCMQDILDPIDNPRYIIIRYSKLYFLQRKDYHAVPDILARNKKTALYFLEMWTKNVGKSKLVYTKNIAGRKILLNARKNALSTSFLKYSERKDIWK